MTSKEFDIRKKLLVNQYKKNTAKIFTAYNDEIKSKGIKSVSESNLIFEKKYQPKFDMITAKHNKLYKGLWLAYYKPSNKTIKSK